MQTASAACTAFGSAWDVNKETPGAVVCTKYGMSWWYNCNGCEKWRLVAWKDGADEFDGTRGYSTKAGKYYGGHLLTCGRGSDNLPLCGVWNAGTNVNIF